MRPVSDRFLSTLRGSHRMVVRARLVGAGQTGVTPTGTEIPVIAGSVTFDATAEVRASLELTTQWPWPTTAADPATPYGNEVFVERGVVYGDGVREWVSLGYFRIDDLDQEEAPDGLVRISARDRMAGIVEARVLAPAQYPGSTTVAAVFGDLVGGLYPGVPISFDFPASGTTFGGSHVIERDRYPFLLDIAQSQGKVMFFDYDGSLVVRTAPDPLTPVWTVNHGRGGVLVGLSRKLTRQGVYNAVVAEGEQGGDAPPVRAVAVDDDPASPTYWLGPFGQVPRFFASSFLTTEAQCATAAQAMLDRARGLPYSVSFAHVPNPALEPLDAVAITYTDRVDPEVHVLDKLTIPLTSKAPMTGITRVQTRTV